MKQYLNLAQHILNNGTEKTDRTGTGTLSVFGYQMRFNLQEGFPLVTTKKVHLKSIIGELLWFISGSTNANELREKYGVTIWDEWADEDGALGRIYSAQWRSWKPTYDTVNQPIDQISEAIKLLQTNPDSRRIIVSAWNVGELELMALPPCHALFQFYTREISEYQRLQIVHQNPELSKEYFREDLRMSEIEGWLNEKNIPTRALDCQLYQRSADTFLGVPFNIASYALLTMMIAQVVNMAPGEFIWTGGDCHIYTNHIEQMKLQISREPHKLPTMKINPNVKDIFSYTPEDFTLENYVSHPVIKGAVAI